MFAIGYVFSLFLGASLLTLLNRNKESLPLGLFLFLSLGLGLGLSAFLPFYSLITIGQYSSLSNIILNLIALAICLFVIFKKPTLPIKKPHLKRFSFKALGQWALWLGLFFLVYHVAIEHPFGEWDAWAIWNLKTKFIISGSKYWTAIFDKLHWHTHPDYPLLLPMINSWVFSFSNNSYYPIPMYTSLLFITGCVGLVYAGVHKYTNRAFAFLASLIVLANPYFAFLSTSQYADVVLGFFLLASVISLFIGLEKNQTSLMFLCGIFLGLMTFTKNEGIFMSLLLIGLVAAYLFCQHSASLKQKQQMILFMLLGYILVSSQTLYLKLFLAPSNDDIIPDLNIQNVLSTNWDQLKIIMGALKGESFDKRWCSLWIYLTISLALGFPRLLTKENKIFIFFLLIYLSVIIFIYLFGQPDVDIHWWLKYSLRRVLLTLIPTLVFFSFYIHSDKFKRGQKI